MRQPDQYYTYEGEEITLLNIFWTKHLDKAWQASWVPKERPASPKSAYGATPKDAHDAIIGIIESERITHHPS